MTCSGCQGEEMGRRPMEANMKVTLNTIFAGPDGTARPGTVLDVSQAVADELLKTRCARPFDRERDANAPRGLTKPKEPSE